MTIRDRTAILDVLREIAGRYAIHIVCFDAEKLAGREHAESALRHAHRSFERGIAISNSLEMEALLYAAGTRECSAAVSFGLHEGENHIYVCCCPAPESVWKDLAVDTCVLVRTLMCVYPRRKPPGLQHCSISPPKRLKRLVTIVSGILVLERCCAAGCQ